MHNTLDGQEATTIMFVCAEGRSMRFRSLLPDPCFSEVLFWKGSLSKLSTPEWSANPTTNWDTVARLWDRHCIYGYACIGWWNAVWKAFKNLACGAPPASITPQYPTTRNHQTRANKLVTNKTIERSQVIVLSIRQSNSTPAKLQFFAYPLSNTTSTRTQTRLRPLSPKFLCLLPKVRVDIRANENPCQ